MDRTNQQGNNTKTDTQHIHTFSTRPHCLLHLQYAATPDRISTPLCIDLTHVSLAPSLTDCLQQLYRRLAAQSPPLPPNL
jgi:hypothetical protein